ncbi:MAG: acylneuraminate cytidylyltransferase [Chloroflexota bacterium]|nr:acylneuraminate cytidylyltransferase [Chloroflexota bacterium]
MVHKPEVLGIVPARGGSKGIPRKNILDFVGYPLIAYSIAAGLQSEHITRLIVTTDDPEIAEIARSFGAEVPFMRPKALAQDDTLDLPVFQHALTWLREKENCQPELVVHLRPTSPVRPVGLVDESIEILLAHPEADSVRGIVPAGQNPFKMWKMGDDGQMVPLLTVEGIDEPYNSPRQALPKVYWHTGIIDVLRPYVILEKASMSGDVILPVHVDPVFSVDIDTPMDWAHCENLVRERDLNMVYPGKPLRKWPEEVSLVVFDFDGVMTDDRVWVDQDGVESVAANRGDGMGVELLLKEGFNAVIISTEPNPVVAVRAKKIGLPYFHGVGDKAKTLRTYWEKENLFPEETVYVGNDVNDLPCFPLVAYAIVVADAHPDVRRKADYILSHKGGYGAVRELCDLLISRYR